MRVFPAISFIVALGAALAGTASGATKGPAERMMGDAKALLAVYLTIKEPRGTFVLGSDRHVGRLQRQALSKQAGDHKLMVVLPELRDIMQEAMTAARIAAHDLSGLRRGAQGLGASNLLAGRLVNTGPDKWSVDWSFANNTGHRRWRVAGVSYADAMKNGLAMAADALAGKAALQPYPLPKLYPLISEDVEMRQEMEMRNRFPN